MSALRLQVDGEALGLHPEVGLVAGFTGRDATVAVLGAIRPAERFAAELGDPAGGRAIELDYRIRPLDRLLRA